MTNDVRMKGFSKRVPLDTALNWVDQNLPQSATEKINLMNSAGRTLASEVTSQVNVPGFRRSMMDGFAIHAGEVLGAGNYNPITLNVIGEVLPGNRCEMQLGIGEAVRVMTGAEVPKNADAVIPVEYVEIKGEAIEVLTSIAEQKNIAKIGEDISANEVVLAKGRTLRPQDVGLLASIGVKEISVFKKPTVKILVTGNELLPPGSVPNGVQIVDSNSPMLAALIERDGGKVINPGIIPDDEKLIAQNLQDECDIVLVAGGSSTGKEDFAPKLVSELGELAIHGIAMRTK